jgi:hypothetical protein
MDDPEWWAGLYDGLHKLPCTTPLGFDDVRYLAGHAHGVVARLNAMEFVFTRGDWRVENPEILRHLLDEIFYENHVIG